MTLLASYSGIWAYIKLILVFVFILLLAFYGAKLAGKYQNNVLNNKSNIKIVESYRIGNNKFLAIAKIGENFYAIGVGKDEFTIIDKLNNSYFEKIYSDNSESKKEEKTSFKDILSKINNKN